MRAPCFLFLSFLIPFFGKEERGKFDHSKFSILFGIEEDEVLRRFFSFSDLMFWDFERIPVIIRNFILERSSLNRIFWKDC